MTHFESVSSWWISSHSFTNSFLFTLGDLEGGRCDRGGCELKTLCVAAGGSSLLTNLLNNVRQVVLQFRLSLRGIGDRVSERELLHHLLAHPCPYIEVQHQLGE